MSLKERLADFAGALAVATNAPADYVFPEFQSYESNMADLKELWSQIRPLLKRDVEQAEFIDAKLLEMRAAFDAGDKDKGRSAVWAIYNLGVEKLR